MAADLLFLCNAKAGGGRTTDQCGYFLRSHPDIARRSRVADVGSSEESIKKIVRIGREKVIVAAGGDGTANMAASALLSVGRTDIPLALLPIGTGNALAHSIGLTSTDATAQALRGGKTRKLAVVRTDHPQKDTALISVSAGFEPSIIDSREKWRHGERLRSMHRLSKAAVSLTAGISLAADGVVLCAASEALFSAGLYMCPSLAFGRRIFPERTPGAFDTWAVVYKTPLSYAKTLLTGGEYAAGIRRVQGWTSAVLDTTGMVQIDGELLPGGKVTLHHCPATLTVVVP
ncbi:MAG: hypothetical protein A2509_01770 [Candidatus Edwardsbacteria bacterium RIFOXYD12_FULL_50_11]|uniref:DAGKc domain-containing protein n=1 Tax=Candidatus Edwardsbacteria bacterium GWF2_54_11 TaxID=1817851 RepID=A0A1F5RCR8_9BACT|nr:MAG: hypothetical protein A2502_03095 [Candidatus Edwardsbacteria bacterium RifOxyC12_full_54_24]OGF07702.1 MAG: hypothetical protein A2273_04345 [Candidatus Edwardsbacteria bacterium RifOxyA12_full_54_48]OGF09953.1 MAG: hypothetical protein A3K15_10755 [Candidatus Edwardsbacteria bacterium GWE2_54_12]OGF12214.1 MAG: hypothetical protein A2024_04310 [Candidatus Edwardsbacteria bacterium GWF2_54_11]OGF16314.1 MAG: hypothetical protein A2509_01770 [Candidatus Edwardsbacteria bacterium RIFOXYD1